MKVTEFTNVFDKRSFSVYLRMLKQNIDVPVAMHFIANYHSINLNYSPKPHQWLLIDANNLPMQTADGIEELTELLIHDLRFSHGEDESVLFGCELFVNENNIDSIKASMKNLQENENW